MRPIKFREWIEEPDDYDIPSHMVSPKFQGDINEVFAQKGDRLGTRYYYMQYTGLKDADGQEIYEGDFLSEGDDIWEVIFDDGCFAVVRQRDWILLSEVCNDLSIAGNIYENPEMREEIK